MDTAPPSLDPRSPKAALQFYFPYRPSNLLCSALIFWTVLCLITEAVFPLLDLIFIVTIYGPTIYLAAQCIRQTLRGTFGPSDSDKMGKKATILSCLWILSIPTHVYIMRIPPIFPDIPVIPVLTGSQAIVIMLYITLRHVMEKRARLDLGGAPTEAEAPPSTIDAESRPLLTSVNQLSIYRPSKTLLVTSTLFAVGSWTAETFCLTWASPHRGFAVFWAFMLLWLYAPLIWLQAYTLKRASRRSAPTLVDEGGIGNYSMDLAAIFVGVKPLIMLCSIASPQYMVLLYTPGTVQGCLVVYTAVRYAWSFSKVIPRYALLDEWERSSDNAVHAPVPESLQAQDTTSLLSSMH